MDPAILQFFTVIGVLILMGIAYLFVSKIELAPPFPELIKLVFVLAAVIYLFSVLLGIQLIPSLRA